MGMEWSWLASVELATAASFTGWFLTTAAAVAGLVFGIRAERRARYKALWARDPEGAFVNRTGEDVEFLMVFVAGAERPMAFEWVSLADSTGVEIPGVRRGQRVLFIWTRPLTGNMYTWPRGPARESRRLRQFYRGALRRTRKTVRADGSLPTIPAEEAHLLLRRDWRP